jgi:threonylcarbamoyladenosine tRNA methylthiotransferase MtaB
MHIFKYSIRKGTRAAAMKGQLTEAMKTKRSAVLLEMEARKSKEYRGQFIGQTVSVLLEEEKEIQGSKYMIGHTREYVKVAVPMAEAADSKNLTNEILEVEIVGFLGEDILLAK